MAPFPAGRLKDRVLIQRKRVANPDDPVDYGNTEDIWLDHLTVWSCLKTDSMTERLAAGAQQGMVGGKIIIRQSSASVAITTADRARFLHGPYAARNWNIRAVVPWPDRTMIDLIVETGGAV